MDSSHPYHIPYNKLSEMLKDWGFQIKKTKYDRGMGLANNSLKKIIGNGIMAVACLWSAKMKQ